MAEKRLRTMVFPGLEDTYTIPQDMNDLESIEAVAEPYDEFTAYAVGDYCSNGGKLYRCNTAIPSGETWNANHWTETNVGDELLAQKAATNTALSGKVSKAGDTMTGHLTLAAGNQMRVRAGFKSNETYSGHQYGQQYRLDDSEGTNIGILRSVHYSGGNEALDIIQQRNVNGTSIFNSLQFAITPSGTKVITISDPAAWREALGLGTSGAFPITIGQGGTGNTRAEATTATASILSAGANITIGSAAYYQWGKMAYVNLQFTASAALSAGAIIGTMVAGKRPPAAVYLLDSTGGLIEINSAGNIYVRHSVSSGATIYVRDTYMLAN